MAGFPGNSILNIFNLKLFVLFFGLGFQCLHSQSEPDSNKHWVGTWACAPYAADVNTPPNPPGLANNTLRQIVRISVGGDTIRLKFSNITSPTPVTFQSVTIAESNGGNSIIGSSLKKLKFNGSESVTMDAMSSVISDPIAYDLKENMRLAISIYYGQCQISPSMTFHYGSRSDSYIMAGDQSASENFGNSATTVERWYHLNTVEVLAPKTTWAVAAIGNSITDGYGLHGGLKNKWTDKFSEALLEYEATKEVAVLNMGIGATNVASGANNGLSRYKQDVLDMPGLRWVIVFYGVNDIGGNADSATIVNAYKSMIEDTHALDTAIKIYGATITPIKNSGYWSDSHEAVRSQVNSWIRAEGNFDGLIDFDKAIRDPNDTTIMRAEFANDYLHPNVEGYKKLGESIDLDMFVPPPLIVGTRNKGEKFRVHGNISHGINIQKAQFKFETTRSGFVSLKIYSPEGVEMGELAGKEISAGKHSLSFENLNLDWGTYIFQLETPGQSIQGKFRVFE